MALCFPGSLKPFRVSYRLHQSPVRPSFSVALFSFCPCHRSNGVRSPRYCSHNMLSSRFLHHSDLKVSRFLCNQQPSLPVTCLRSRILPRAAWSVSAVSPSGTTDCCRFPSACRAARSTLSYAATGCPTPLSSTMRKKSAALLAPSTPLLRFSALPSGVGFIRVENLEVGGGNNRLLQCSCRSRVATPPDSLELLQ